MKYNIKITFFMLGLFLATQLIGLYVVNHYMDNNNQLPYNMEPPQPEQESDFITNFLPSILVAFVIAVIILFLLMKFKADIILRIWFFIVVAIALGISINAFLPQFKNASLVVLIITLPLAFFKVFKRNFLVHNITELFIYPGIAAVFVPLLNIWTIIILLILISIYDMWAVWKSKIMIKMAKYQMNTLKIFGGFSVPYASKKTKAKIKKMSKKDLEKKKVKVNLAILGGGDVVFPLIAAGVMLKTINIWASLIVLLGALLGLSYLFFLAKKNKWYPAMPFLTAGLFLGMIVSALVF